MSDQLLRARSDQRPPFCAEDHHLEWWEVMERFRRDGGMTAGGEARLRHCTGRLAPPLNPSTLLHSEGSVPTSEPK